MIYEIWISIAILLTGIVGIWFAYKYYKKKKQIATGERNVPDDILKEFNEAEQKMKGGLKEDGTTKSPHEILWEITRGGSYKSRGNDKDSIGTEQTVNDRDIHEQPNRREDIQTRTPTIAIEDKSIIRESKPNNFRRIISRIRRSTGRS